MKQARRVSSQLGNSPPGPMPKRREVSSFISKFLGEMVALAPSAGKLAKLPSLSSMFHFLSLFAGVSELDSRFKANKRARKRDEVTKSSRAGKRERERENNYPHLFCQKKSERTEDEKQPLTHSPKIHSSTSSPRDHTCVPSSFCATQAKHQLPKHPPRWL